MLACQRCVDGCVQFGWPPSPAPRVLVRYKREVQGCQIVPCDQRCNFCLFGLPDNLTMRAHEVADRRVREKRLVVSLPAEEAGNRDKG